MTLNLGWRLKRRYFQRLNHCAAPEVYRSNYVSSSTNNIGKNAANVKNSFSSADLCSGPLTSPDGRRFVIKFGNLEAENMQNTLTLSCAADFTIYS